MTTSVRQLSDVDGRSHAYAELVAPVAKPLADVLAGTYSVCRRMQAYATYG